MTNGCLIILSTKCAGSTALHRVLATADAVNPVRVTEHYENETLFWVKAAAVLGRPQEDMSGTAVPYARDVALASLDHFLQSNGVERDLGPTPSLQTIVEAW